MDVYHLIILSVPVNFILIAIKIIVNTDIALKNSCPVSEKWLIQVFMALKPN